MTPRVKLPPWETTPLRSVHADAMDEEVTETFRQWIKLCFSQAITAVNEVRRMYPVSVFPKDGKSIDCLSAGMARQTCDNIKDKLAERLNETLETLEQTMKCKGKDAGFRHNHIT